MTYYAVRSREHPNLFVNKDGLDSFVHTTLHHFHSRTAFEHFITCLPPQFELVEVTFQPITHEALN